jgi:hypothetical protein
MTFNSKYGVSLTKVKGELGKKLIEEDGFDLDNAKGRTRGPAGLFSLDPGADFRQSLAGSTFQG